MLAKEATSQNLHTYVENVWMTFSTALVSDLAVETCRFPGLS